MLILDAKLYKIVRIPFLMAALAALSACSLEMPSDVEQGNDLTLASRIEYEAQADRVTNLIRSATFDALTNQILLSPTGGDDDFEEMELDISNGATGQFIGSAQFGLNEQNQDDDDEFRTRRIATLSLNNLIEVPCSIRVQSGRRAQVVPVINAPLNCSGIAATPAGTSLLITSVDWDPTASDLLVSGNGAIPRDLVTVFDSITGQLLGTDQSGALGRWRVRARNLAAAPCVVTVISGGTTMSAPVMNAPFGCGNLAGTLPGQSGFNQPPQGVIIGPIADMAISVGTSVNFMATGFDPDSSGSIAYLWDFDGAQGNTNQQNTTVIFNQPGVYTISLTAIDINGLVDPTPDTRVIVVQPNLVGGGVSGNQPPSGVIVSPQGNVEINAGSAVNFTASGTDPEGSLLTYSWSFAGGAPSVNMQNPGAITFSSPGVYTVSLTVTDSQGLSDPSPEFRVITVRGGNTGNVPGAPINPGNLAPEGQIISPATDISIGTGQSVDFFATAFDVDNNNPLRYRWNFGGARQTSNQLNPGSVTFNRAGIYVVTFTVTDSLGLSDYTPSTRVITVGNPGNAGGILAPDGMILSPATNVTISAGQSVDFMGSVFSNNETQSISYFWDFSGAAPSSVQQNPGSVNFAQPGTYVVTLTVADVDGNSDPTPAIRTVTVLPSTGSCTLNCDSSGGNLLNAAPDGIINLPATDMQITVGQAVEFAAIATDPENDSPIAYQWDFDGAAPSTNVQNPGFVTFAHAGSYRVRLVAKDKFGNQDLTPAERIISVTDPFNTNLPPESRITSPANSVTISAGESVNFSGYATDIEGNSFFQYEWDFGGAAPESNLQNPGSIQFNNPGIYKVALYVKDALGAMDTTPDVRFITVTNAANVNSAPEATITAPITDVTINVGDSVLFNGSGYDQDNFGSFLSYSWDFNGGAINSSQASPGLVVFNQPGIYAVKLSVMDSFGAFDATPAVRMITVVDTSPSNQAPIITLLSPVSEQQNIMVGQSLSFSASAIDPENEAVSYYWSFDGATSDSTLQSPGNIIFNKPGIYQVKVYAIDARNKRSTPVSTQITVTGQQGFSAVAPEGNIVSPVGSITIALGESVNFSATAINSDNNLPLSYRWDFDGIAATSTAQNPGNVTFDRTGTFSVKLTVADNTGATDLTPAVTTVIVTPGVTTGSPGSNAGNSTPTGTILSPTSAVTTIQPGQAVNFSATGFDANNSGQLAYYWNFGGGATESFVANPGPVLFSTPGIYTVTLTVTDSTNISDPTPEIRTVIVSSGPGTGGAGDAAPDAHILAPSTNVTISRGQSVYFTGGATDPDGDANLVYSWDFGGGASASTQKTPGSVAFNSAGQFEVSLTVTDSTGLSDLTPSIVLVTVLP